MTGLLELRHLSKRFPIEGGVLRRSMGFVQALDDVSLTIERGETLALVGGSGCGKSTLARLVTGLAEADAGDLLWEGRALSTFTPRERAHRIQMIFQDPYASLNPKLSIGTQLGEVVAPSFRRKPEPSPIPLGPGFRRGDVKSRCVEILESVGLSADVLSHYPFQFSGGQRQRIAIARALATEPRLLIADEPLSALDVTTQAQILDLFAQMKTSFQLTFLFITHDLAVARAFSERIVVLKEGRVVEEGSSRSVLENPQNDYTRALLNAVPKIPC